MARTALPVQTLTDAGAAPTFTAANADGNSVPPGSVLYFKNTNGSPRVVSIPTPATLAGKAVEDASVSVPATTGERVVGGLRSDLYAQDDGSVYLNYDAVTGLTVAVLDQ